MSNAFLVSLVGVFAFVAAGPSVAATVEYDWMNQSGPLDSGTMFLTLSSGTPDQFTQANLSSLIFTFQDGTTAKLGANGLKVSSLSGTGWSAGTNGASSQGYLTSTALISNAPHAAPIFTFQFQPYSGQSTGVDQATMGVQQSFGVWKENLSFVPVPASLPLFLGGLFALGAIGWRVGRSRAPTPLV